MEQATIRRKTDPAKFQVNLPTESKIMQHGRIPPLNLVHSKYLKPDSYILYFSSSSSVLWHILVTCVYIFLI